MLVVAMNTVIILSALAASLLVVAFSQNREHMAAESRMRAFYIAEAGLNDAVADLVASGTGNLGSEGAPRAFNGGEYWVTTEEISEGNLKIVSNGKYDGEWRGIEAIVDPTGRTGGYFNVAAAGNEGTEVNGDAFTDSYDSSQGTYVSQATTPHGPGLFHAQPGGTVESNGPVTVETGTGLFGDATGQTVDDASGAVTGSTFPRMDYRPYPPVMVPPAGAPVALNLTAGAQFVGPGSLSYSTLDISGSGQLLVTGPATLVVGDLDIFQLGQLIVNAAAGPVYLYVTGSLSIRDAAVVASFGQRPQDILVFSDVDNHTGHESTDRGDPARPLALGGAADVYGVLYAPNGTVNLSGASELFGSVAAKKVVVTDDASIHYDEILGTLTGIPVGKGGMAGSWTTGAGGYGQRTIHVVTWRQVAPGSGVGGFDGGLPMGWYETGEGEPAEPQTPIGN